MSEAFIYPSKSEEEKPIAPEEMPVPKGWRILVEMIEPRRQTKGGIILADTSVEAQEYLRYVGKVIAMGPLCYKHGKFLDEDEGAKPAWCKVGDWIAFGQHAGQNMEIRGRKFRFINDDNVMGVIPDPSVVKIYIE